MMEVIPINTSNNTISKSDLWSDRIQWIRKIRSETSEPQDSPDPVFAKLPSEQELQDNAGARNHPVTILLPKNIRIEVGANCPARQLLTALLQALKSYA